jgi:predicted Zn-dependent peptidase
MRDRSILLALGLTAAALLLPARRAAAAEAATPAPASALSIPFTKTTLPNGLVVIFSEDHTVPQVAVNTAFDVGARMERSGRTGFAHLFEHLMFMGTQRAPRGAFDGWMEAAGGRNNATTGEDLTDYFDIAPPTALPLLLWLEADRMRELGRLIDGPKLDLQREVVLNERRQSIENRPYGVEELVLPELVWPAGHPYHHPVIGSPADLQAATVGDVKQFFETWYDPANASVAIAGDFDPQAAQALIERWFGTVPSHGKPDAGEAARGKKASDLEATRIHGVVRQTVPDQVELSKVTLAWQSPAHFAPGDAEMDLLASVLSHGKASRLYKALVYDQKIAQSVEAGQQSQVLGSQFVVSALARPGVDPAKLEKAMLAEVAKLREKEVTAEELERARNEYEMAFVEGLQSIPERASLLNVYQTEVGDPGYVQHDLDRYRKASVADLKVAAQRVLAPDSMVVLTIVPRKEGSR